ncbi:uncharacterized protein LOC112351025 [Selaginella moellendorffii]|uniref:uncharacterized protein LOC112351025 n=1 Tax=Selaginella moellendorffii TaxID=88036 RepID=UPI000D1CFC65|nr:uncharacterized protein LOC112351025 [Selaginella moellendorffii]|eukprot:XP_024543924.1 uncharacterized protein LOC112351025 [Selaginella moellendorffii]
MVSGILNLLAPVRRAVVSSVVNSGSVCEGRLFFARSLVSWSEQNFSREKRVSSNRCHTTRLEQRMSFGFSFGENVLVYKVWCHRLRGDIGIWAKTRPRKSIGHVRQESTNYCANLSSFITFFYSPRDQRECSVHLLKSVEDALASF